MRNQERQRGLPRAPPPPGKRRGDAKSALPALNSFSPVLLSVEKRSEESVPLPMLLGYVEED